MVVIFYEWSIYAFKHMNHMMCLFISSFLLLGDQLKGQTQKMQQAILHVLNYILCSSMICIFFFYLTVNCLQKFRSGEYNILVATSIGEEGLDIMEVDLVVCFDANISALRMIQRMGRTGRKNEGRVDILFLVGEN